MATMDQSAYSIALDNRHVPGVEEAIKHAGDKRFGGWSERFRDYFGMLADGSGKPIKDVSADILWINFMNLVRDDMDHKEAINLFIGPVAEALAAKMDSSDTGSLQSNEIAQLGHTAGETARKALWLADENRASVQKLAVAAVNQWLRMFDQKQALKTTPGDVPHP